MENANEFFKTLVKQNLEFKNDFLLYYFWLSYLVLLLA